MTSSNCETSLSTQALHNYESQGFTVLKQLFSASEIAELQEESDRLLTDFADLISPGNLRCRYMPHFQSGESLFEVFDPVNDLSPVCERFTSDVRIVTAVEAIYGESACLFKEKLIFKPPGAQGYNLHQDIPFGWAGFPRTFLTVMIPIDPSTQWNGCTEVFSGYHRDFLSRDPGVYMLPDDVVELSRRTFLSLEPGDVAIFHGLTPHRSGPNRSDRMRRVLYVSYNARSDGGDQRTKHYREFHERLSQRPRPGVSEPLYFR